MTYGAKKVSKNLMNSPKGKVETIDPKCPFLFSFSIREARKSLVSEEDKSAKSARARVIRAEQSRLAPYVQAAER